MKGFSLSWAIRTFTSFGSPIQIKRWLDYPDFAHAVAARGSAAGSADVGVVIDGAGVGSSHGSDSIKFPGLLLRAGPRVIPLK
jgi:hypothetical protein